MRSPYPERVPINRAALFASALFIVQALEGTPLYFCAGCTIFILLAALAFNAGGGLTRASGVYVFFYSVMVVLIGICYKAYLGEPAQSNLVDPRTDIEAYVGSMLSMYGAVTLSRLFSRPRGLLEDVLKEADMHRASIGCMLFGAFGMVGVAMLGTGFRTAFSQVNLLVPVGIIIGIMYEIRSSGGSRCTNIFVVLATLYSLVMGMLGFSKQGMILPIFCWLLPICALRYRLSFVQVLSSLAIIFIVFYYLVPYSQYGRGQVSQDTTSGERMEIAFALLSHPNETRRLFLQSEEEQAYKDIRGFGSYYNKPQGFWERLQFVSVDDGLNNVTDQGHVFGLLPVAYGFANIVPHFLWPNKPGANLGNMYGHEISGDMEGQGDVTTGISFSPTGEAYHLAKWAGIFALAPLLWFTAFTALDILLGDIRRSPWGLLAVAIISHVAPEGGIVGTIGLFSFDVEVLIFCALFSVWFAPMLAAAILGPSSQTVSA
ncbi:MAG TPA: hypothetical protein VGU46_03920 [Acidobacteriaceae bacterium]|nr:hypothetical protein [Acidobacteriaceae bacterium]